VLINTPVQCPHTRDERSFCHPSTNFANSLSTFLLDQLAQENKFQHLAPTVSAMKNNPRWPPSELVRRQPHPSTKQRRQRYWRRKKGKALADNTPQEAFEDEAISKRQRQDHPTPEGTLRTCSSEGIPQAPPAGFAPPEGKDAIEDGEVIGISTEDQLRALRIKNHNLQKQKEILEAKRQCVTTQAKVRQMIQDEEQRARELELEITLMQGKGQYNLQHGPLAPLAPL
jgi:hypothetical protein